MFTEEQKNFFPMKQKLAFPHPMRPDLKIFIGGEIPHWIKQLVIALERSGIKPSTDLEFKGKKLSLAMLQAVWEKYCDEFGEMRTNRNTTEHYVKNSYNRMGV